MTVKDKPREKPKTSALTPITRSIIETSATIKETQPERADFLHTVLCQVGMPRSRQEGQVFERRCGNSSLILEAGKLWLGGQWQDQPLPYGSHPRLVMVHVSSEALRTKNCVVEVGASTRAFLRRLGISTSGGRGGGLTSFKRQMQALAACRLTLGYSRDGHDVTINAKPIESFEAWVQNDERQMALWPGVMELSRKFYDTLTEHAVPLDPRALSALKHSALALDIYSWLAHRLCRVRQRNGVLLSWDNVMDQFGQEYNDPKNFRRKFLTALRQVKPVYPDAKLEIVRGGIRLYSSMPPIPKTKVMVALPYQGDYTPWKDRPKIADPKPR